MEGRVPSFSRGQFLRFELLQSINLNGSVGVPSEDRVGCTTTQAWVVDGATDLGKPGLLSSGGGSAWIANSVHQYLYRSHEQSIETTCQRLFHFLEDSFQVEKTRDPLGDWEIPSAAFLLAEIANNSLNFASAADCSALVISGSSVEQIGGALDSTTETTEARSFGPGIAAAQNRSEDVTQNRRSKRVRGRYAALTTDANLSANATRFGSCAIRLGDNVLLMSDGFSCLLDRYSLYTKEGLGATLFAEGLAGLAIEIRNTELQDPEGWQFPRFKVSDDMSALWLRVVD